MLRRLATIIAVMLLFVACTKALPEDKAVAVLKDLGPALASMEGTGQADKDVAIRQICEKHGVELKALAIYLEKNPGAADKLVQFTAQAFAEDLEEMEGEYKAKLKAIDDDKKAGLEKIRSQNTEARREAEMAAARKAGQAARKFEAQKAALLQQLKKLQTQF